MFRHIIGVGLGLVLSISSATCNEGCTPYPHAVYTTQKQIDDDYRAELKQCVRTYQTKELVDMCQEDVRWRYGVCLVKGPPGVLTYAPCRRAD